jgi:hypothetical protein
VRIGHPRLAYSRTRDAQQAEDEEDEKDELPIEM